MPVMRTPEQQPEWTRWSNFGFAEVTDADAFDRHFHDADEYWMVFSGRARVLSEGVEYELGPGDVLATAMGEEHDILELLESPLRTFWFEDVLRGRCRPGHLHHPEDD